MTTTRNGNVSSATAQRWRLLGAALGGCLLIAVGYTVYWAQVLRYHQRTDDTYVGGNVVQITPQISGTVVAIGADDTQFVKAGQALVRLDQSDAQVALDQAEAQLARTVRDVRNLFATTSQLEATVQVGVFSPRPRPLPRLSLERGRAGRHLRPPPDDLLRVGNYFLLFLHG